MVTDPKKWTSRVQRWFSGTLSPDERANYYDMLVTGARDVDTSMQYDAFACLVALTVRDLEYVQLDVDGGVLVNSQTIREIIDALEPDSAAVQEQARLANVQRYGASQRTCWYAARRIAELYQLPVAVLAIATGEGGDLVVVQRSIQIAPLPRVAQAFRELAPLQ